MKFPSEAKLIVMINDSAYAVMVRGRSFFEMILLGQTSRVPNTHPYTAVDYKRFLPSWVWFLFAKIILTGRFPDLPQSKTPLLTHHDTPSQFRPYEIQNSK